MDHAVVGCSVKKGYLFDDCSEIFHRRNDDFRCMTGDVTGMKRPSHAGADRLCSRWDHQDGTRDGGQRLFGEAISGVFHGNDAQLLVI